MERNPQQRRLLFIGMDGMNLVLLRRFIAEGRLPNFVKLMQRGSTNRLLPAIPAWTPTNWATMVTGTTPGTHQLGGWTVRQKSDPWDAPRLDSWDSRAIGRADTIWQSAEDAGLRTVIQFYPSGVWPNPLKKGFVVAPGFHDAPFVLAAPMVYYARTQQTHQAVTQVAAAARERSTDWAETGAPEGSSEVPLEPATGWAHVPPQALVATLPMPLIAGGEEPLYLLAVPAEDHSRWASVAVCDRPDGAAVVASLTLDAWSPFYHRTMGPDQVPAAMRFRWLGGSPADGVVHLCRTQAYATTGFTSPPELSAQLVEACGPWYNWYTVNPTLGEAELRTFTGDLLYQGEWLARSAKYLLEHYGWDLHFSHWHLFDHVNHPTVNDADPEGPHYDPERGAWMIECQRRVYEVGDRVLGQFLELADDNTIVCVISDHAMAPAHRWADVAALLVERGLLVYRDAAKKTVDWTRSVAYVQADRGSEVFINLKGREPQGIVAPERYDAVQTAVIDALLDWRDPGTGQRPIALALKLQDAQIIGFWGETNGDVVLTYNRGYGWGPPLDGATAGPGREALHGSQIPTSETAYFTNMATLILAGPGIKVGYERDWQHYGLMRMVDVAPTLSQLLGIRPPRHAIGAVLTDVLQDA